MARPNNPPQPWSRPEIETLRREWLRGTKAKVIGGMLEPPKAEGAVIDQVYKLRAEARAQGDKFSWPLRRGALQKPDRMSIYLDIHTASRAKSRAHTLGISLSAYLRKLIERDT